MSRDRGEIWTYGHRNPFTFGMDPLNGTIYINDVGETTWEEIDVAAPGADYGWPDCEGPFLTGTSTQCEPSFPAYAEPIFWYPHTPGMRDHRGRHLSPHRLRVPGLVYRQVLLRRPLRRMDPVHRSE